MPIQKPIAVVGLFFCCLLLLLTTPAEGAEKWLIYIDGALLPDKVEGYVYYGYEEYPDIATGTPDIGQRTKEIFHRIYQAGSPIRKGKPTITKKDETHVVLFYKREVANALSCIKAEDSFTQSDAPVVPPTKVEAKAILSQAALEPVDMAANAFTCDIESRDKGNTKITYTIDKTIDTQNKENLVKAAVRVHELYRFRITSGPVFSSLIRKNKSFSTITNASGQQVISSSRANDSPVNYPIFLKAYLGREGRDILVDPPYWYSLERISPIIGINLVDNPLKNFYAGLSWEPWLGIDIVAGAHIARLSQLDGRFSEGQIVAAGTQPATTNRFLAGGFVGVTADIGVIGSWLGSTIGKTIREGFR